MITGGAGFIGSALARGLLSLGDGEVIVIDNLFSGHEKNLEEIRSRITFHKADIRDRASIASPIAGADTLFHLAAIPSVPRSIAEPDPSHEVNIDGTFNVMRAAADGKARRVVYAASSSAYGNTETLPEVETMLASPLSPYAAQKLMGEYYVSVFSSCFGVEGTSLRFFNVFGPRQDPSSPYSGVLSLFMKHLIARTSPTIFGDGEQTRDFTFVEDVVGLLIKAAQAPTATGKTYNAGNGFRFSLNQTWDLLQKIEGVSIPAKYGPPRAGDVMHSLADTSAAIADLGHTPENTFESGLRKTLEWYRGSS